MRKILAAVLTACLLCHLERRFVFSQQTSSDWEGELGVDMCPECRPLPSLVRTSTPGNFFEEDLGVDGELGVDMCPECRPLPSLVRTSTPGNFFEEDLGVDGELGVDMCPECQPLPSLVRTSTPGNFFEEDLGVDMCPEKGQPMAGDGMHAGQNLAVDSNSLVKELQQLLKVQQSQINQLGGLLQQLGKNCHSGNLGVMQTPTSRDSSGSQFSERQEIEDVPSLDLEKTTARQNSIEGKGDGNTASTHVDSGVLLGEEAHGSGVVGMTVVPYRPSWLEHFSFLSAVKVDEDVSSLFVLPEEGDGGATRYAVGDVNGELYIFLWLGDLLLHHRTISTAPITAMLSYSLQKTEIILVTGHADGGVVVHQIKVSIEQGMTNLSSIATLHSLIPPSPQSLRMNVEGRNSGDESDASMHVWDTSASIVNLETFKVGKMRYTIVVDTSGKIQLFRENGSLHGIAQSPSRPLAFIRNPNVQRLTFLTEKGVGTLDLRSMQVRSSLCVDLNTSTVTAYAFDTVGRSKADGFTTEGDLVSVVLRGDILNFECQVKRRDQLEIAGPVAALSLRGYLVAATPERVFVFNTTLQSGFSYANLWVAGPRLTISVAMNEIASSILKAPIPRSNGPVVASNGDRILVLGLGGGYVGVFRSNLPVKPTDFSAKFSNIAFFISVLVLLAMWQLLNRKKYPEAAVNSEFPSTLSPSSSADGKLQSARLSLGEREKVVEPRRFKSPTRGYVFGNPKSFGSTSRKFSVSRADSDSYISARKEPLFASTQPVEESEPRQ